MRQSTKSTSSHPVRGRVLRTLLVLGFAAAAFAAPPIVRYGMRDLGALPGGYSYSFARGVNNAGEVVGFAYAPTNYLHAFVRSGGTMSDLGTLPGGNTSDGYAINASGQVVGVANTATGEQHAFLYTAGTMTDLGTLPINAGVYGYSTATAINDVGQVAGTSYVGGGIPHSFLWQPTTPNGTTGSMIDLGTFPGAAYDSSYATGINELGQVCGSAYTASFEQHAFLYDGGTMTDLGTLPGGTWSYATGINDLGQVCGYGYTNGYGLHAFLYDGGTMTDLGTLPGGYSSYATGINALGQVCGSADTPLGTHSFLYGDGVMTDLGTLPFPGGNYSGALGINDSGDVVGFAVSDLVSGYSHAFLAAQIVNDTTPPTIVVAPTQRRSADINGHAKLPDFTGTVVAIDDCTNVPLTITQSPPAGTIAGVGDTTVTVTVTDSAGNATTGTTTFTVLLGILPPRGPVALYSGPLPVGYATADVAGIEGDRIIGAVSGVGAVVWDANAPDVARVTVGNVSLTGIDGDRIIGSDASGPAVWNANDLSAAPIRLSTGTYQGAYAYAISGDRVFGYAYSYDPVSDSWLTAYVVWNDPSADPVPLSSGSFVYAYPFGIGGDRVFGYGYADTNYAAVPVLWNANDPSAGPVALNAGLYSAYAYVSDVDGRRVVGYGYDGVSNHYDFLLWDASDVAAAPVALSQIPAGYLTSYSLKVDGDRIVGFGVDWNEYAPGVFVWDARDPAAAPVFLNLGPLINPYFNYDPSSFYAYGFAIDGDRIVGSGYETNSYYPFSFLVTAPSMRLVAPATIVQECEDDSGSATVHFVFDVDPESATVLRVLDVTGGRTLLEVNGPAHQAYGIGPVEFPRGTSDVLIQLFEGTRLIDSAAVAVQVADTVAPVLAGCTAKTLELRGPLTALIPAALGITASDACDLAPTVSVAPGAVPLGTTSVTATASDSSGNNASCVFDVTVVDTTPPMFTVAPADVERTCTGGTALVSFDVLAADLSGSVTMSCTDEHGQPVDPSGTAFPNGSHTVTCTATDPSGNASVYVFYVTILDDQSPVIVVPADITVATAPGVAYAFVPFTVTATDDCDPTVAIQTTTPSGPVQSGDVFLVGTTTVTCTAGDHAGNIATATFNITVQDREAPVMSGPASVTLTTNCKGSPLTLSATLLGVSATDNYDSSVAIVVTPSTVSPGTTQVVCTARDDDGNQSQKTVQVTVLKGSFEIRFLKPLDANVDNRIRPGRPVPVKIRVVCGSDGHNGYGRGCKRHDRERDGRDGPGGGHHVDDGDGDDENDGDRCTAANGAGMTAVIDRVERIDGAGTPIGNDVAQDGDLSSDSGVAMRAVGDDQFVHKLSTAGWPATKGARFRVVVRVMQAGHADSFGEVILKNR